MGSHSMPEADESFLELNMTSTTYGRLTDEPSVYAEPPDLSWDAFGKLLLVFGWTAVILMVVIALAVGVTWHRIEEDTPEWNCSTMGNLICVYPAQVSHYPYPPKQ